MPCLLCAGTAITRSERALPARRKHLARPGRHPACLPASLRSVLQRVYCSAGHLSAVYIPSASPQCSRLINSTHSALFTTVNYTLQSWYWWGQSAFVPIKRLFWLLANLITRWLSHSTARFGGGTCCCEQSLEVFLLLDVQPPGVCLCVCVFVS